MTNAPNNQARFSAYLDGTLSEEEMTAFEQELAQDPALEAEFDAYSESTLGLGQLRDASALDLSIDLTEGVKSRIRRRSRGRYFSRHSEQRQRTQIHLFVLSAIALLLGAAVFATPNVLSALFGEPDFVRIDPASAPERGDAPPSAEPPGSGQDPLEGSGDQGTEPALPASGDEGAGIIEPPTPSRQARAGQGISDLPEFPTTRLDHVYTFQSHLDHDALVHRLREQFASRVRIDDEGTILVAIDRGNVQTTLSRISDLGVLHRELVQVDPTTPTVDIRFRAAP